MRLGKVVKSNSHFDYVVQVDDGMDVPNPPDAESYGFGSFVRLEGDRHWAVGIVYNSQLFNPLFLNNGPRLSSEPDPLFTPDLINETRTLLSTVLIGSLAETASGDRYGEQGIPRAIVPVNTPVYCLSEAEIAAFHRDRTGQPQFRYYSLLLRYAGNFASHLTQQVLQELADLQLFAPREQRALEMLCRELAWRNTLGPLQAK
ncbi:hypothetical protein VZH09_12355 [Synechococcus elongatus IITB7]|uniref:hypothetical protein n=1 Tax=Synechococcus elongatus TaxID=32046 RepID=UPI0030CD23E8